MSVPRHLRVLPRERGHLQTHRQRTQTTTQQDDGQVLQVRFLSKIIDLFSDKAHIKSLHNTPSLQDKMEPPNHCLAVQNQHNLH